MSIFKDQFKTRSTSVTIGEHLYGDKEPDRNLLPGERSIGDLIIPNFQRKFVWNDNQKKLLIESLFMGLPIGGIVINRPRHDFQSQCSDLLLDGQQRMTTIKSYIDDEFEVEGYFFSDISKSDQRFFRQITIGENIAELTSIEDCITIYNRLAYGGSEHKPSHYNLSEI